jgi:hypothetical protein
LRKPPRSDVLLSVRFGDWHGYATPRLNHQTRVPLLKSGGNAEAEPLLKRALTITEQTLGPEHLDVGTRLGSSLLGQIEDAIKDKRLLIVPSGPLTQLPFQVLVQSLPSDVSAVERPPRSRGWVSNLGIFRTAIECIFS